MIRPRLVAKAALFNESGDILVLTRSKHDETNPGMYDFPGGSLDEGESPTEAVLREIHEEIGVKLTRDQVELGYSATQYYENRSRVRFLFVGMLPVGAEIVLSDEHQAFEWMPMQSVQENYKHPVWVGGLKYLIENNQL